MLRTSYPCILLFPTERSIILLKSKYIRRLLHILIVLVGAGLGVAVTLGGLQVYRWLRPAEPLALIYLASGYILMAALGALIFHLLSDRIISACTDMTAAIERYMDKLSMTQLVSSTLGLIVGMLVAALLCQILSFLGDSIFTTAASALLHVVLGITGFSIGRRRSSDMAQMMDKALSRTNRRKIRTADETFHLRPKVIDASTLIDSRILDVCRLGFMEGEIIIPAFVLEELRRIADSSDSIRPLRGRRGLDIVQRLQEEAKISVRLDATDYPELTENNRKLLRLARELDAAVITGDANLCKLARMSGMHVLNLNELSAALRPAVIPGEVLTVQLLKEGKEAGQGVGYMPDGTMIVVDGGRSLIGKTVTVTVTSALQTNAGRMIFAHLQDEAADS